MRLCYKHTYSGLQSGWLSIVLTLQAEERLTVGLDPSVQSAVSVLLLNCLFLSYSFNYGEQEVKESHPLALKLTHPICDKNTV